MYLSKYTTDISTHGKMLVLMKTTQNQVCLNNKKWMNLSKLNRNGKANKKLRDKNKMHKNLELNVQVGKEKIDLATVI